MNLATNNERTGPLVKSSNLIPKNGFWGSVIVLFWINFLEGGGAAACHRTTPSEFQ